MAAASPCGAPVLSASRTRVAKWPACDMRFSWGFVLTICLAWAGSVTRAARRIPSSRNLGALLAFIEPTSEENFETTRSCAEKFPAVGCNVGQVGGRIVRGPRVRRNGNCGANDLQHLCTEKNGT